MEKQQETQTYKVLKGGWIAGMYRQKGDELELSEAGARYELRTGRIGKVVEKKTTKKD